MFPIIDLTGTPRERGHQYGGHARERIVRSIDNYARLFAFGGMSWRDVQRRALDYREPIAMLAPALLDEIDGIAEGAGLAIADILALNSRTEMLPPLYQTSPSPELHSVLSQNRQNGVGNRYEWGECTALAVLPSASRDGQTWLAQNWDWVGAQRHALVVLRIADDDGGRRMTLTEAGMLAKIGLNDRGVGVCLNLLRSTDDGETPGLPVHVLLAHLLERCDSVDAACDVAQSVAHGASSNVLVADAAGRAASLELSPRGIAVIAPSDGTLVHTNHYLDRDQARFEAPNPVSTTRQRLACAQRYATNMPIGRREIEQLLRDESQGVESVCRRPDPALPEEVRLESVAGIIMDLTARTMWIAPDVPSNVEFESVGLGQSMPID